MSFSLPFKRTLPAIATVLVAAASVVVVSQIRAGASTSTQPAVPPHGTLFGATVPSLNGQSGSKAVSLMEARLGRTLSIDRSYSDWDDSQPNWAIKADILRGRTPLLSISPQLRNGTKLPWSSVASGSHDAGIRNQARELAALKYPVMLAFHHEADVATGFGTAADFVAAFRHYVAVFRSENASNVSFAVILTADTYNGEVSSWYPGDDVVDWIGADAYNFAGCRSGLPGWRSLAQASQGFYDWGSAKGKPLVLAEWGSAEDPSSAGRKAQWLTDAGQTLRNWPNIKAASYFDATGTCDWRLDTSSGAWSAFKTLARSAAANGVPTARLTPAAPTGTGSLTVTFDGQNSTGSGSATSAGISWYSFDPGDGSAVIQRAGEPSTIEHTYGPGTYTAVLRVVDAAGHTAKTQSTVQVD